MNLCSIFICLAAADLIISGFIAPRSGLSMIPGLKNKWSERNEARWLEFRACCGECLVLSGAALLGSVVTESLIPAVAVLPLCVVWAILSFKRICNKIR